jgi:hypothetical protein
MVFGKNLSSKVETRGLVDAFGGYSIQICRLDKKIGFDEI